MSCEYGAYLVFGWQAEPTDLLDTDGHIRLQVGQHFTAPMPDHFRGPIDIETLSIHRDWELAAWQSGLWAEFWLGVGFRVGDHTGREIPLQAMDLAAIVVHQYAGRHRIEQAPTWWLILTNEDAT